MNGLKRIIRVLLCITFIASIPITFSACKITSCAKNSDIPALNITYNNIYYRRDIETYESDVNNHYPDELKAYGNYYYTAGQIAEYDAAGNPITVRHIAAEINGTPVMWLGFATFMNSAHMLHNSRTLEKLYIPGTIISMPPTYFSSREGTKDDVSIYYCGKPLNLYNFNADGKRKVYVPNQMYSEYLELLPETVDEIPFNKANVSYRLNVQELPKYYQTEYYYVDYVEYGETIENIPPEPTLNGYKFGGWYTEADCINKWDFANAVPQSAKGEDFNELCLYAKWIKN